MTTYEKSELIKTVKSHGAQPLIEEKNTSKKGINHYGARTGSTFWFSVMLPLTGEGEKIISLHQEIQIKPLSILLVEDISLNRKMARLILEKVGHRVSEACDGKEAVSQVSAEQFDVVLMDIHMPEMDGVDATKLIRKLPDKIRAATPIIALTADVALHNIDYYLSVGMDAYASKPIDFKELNKQFSKLAIGTSVPAPGQNKGKVPNKAGEKTRENIEPLEIPLVSLETYQKALNLVPEMLDMFKEGAEEYLEQSREGIEASDWSNYADSIHALRSLALSLGFTQLSSLCGEAEAKTRNIDHEIESQVIADQFEEITDSLTNTLLQVDQTIKQVG